MTKMPGYGSLEECGQGLGSGLDDGYNVSINSFEGCESCCDICALDEELTKLSDTYESDRDEFVDMIKRGESNVREPELSITDKPEADPWSENDAWSDYLILSGKSVGRRSLSTPAAPSCPGGALALSSDELVAKYRDVAKSVESVFGKMSPEEFAEAYREGTVVAADPTNNDDCQSRSEVPQVPRSWSQTSEPKGAQLSVEKQEERPVANRWRRRMAVDVAEIKQKGETKIAGECEVGDDQSLSEVDNEAHAEYFADIRDAHRAQDGRPIVRLGRYNKFTAQDAVSFSEKSCRNLRKVGLQRPPSSSSPTSSSSESPSPTPRPSMSAEGSSHRTDEEAETCGVATSAPQYGDNMFDWDSPDLDDKAGEIIEMERQGKITKVQGNSLGKIWDMLIVEYSDANSKGEDVQIFIRRVTKESSGLDCLDAVSDLPANKIQGLVEEGNFFRIRNGITVDSGSSVFVMPSGWMEMFELEESEGQRRGQTYQAAAKGSKPIKNEGQRIMKFTTDKGEKRKMTCQVAGVNKILASVAQVCDGGNHVLFRADGGEIINLATDKRTPFRRVGNIYVMDAWVEKNSGSATMSSDVDMGFNWPEAR